VWGEHILKRHILIRAIIMRKLLHWLFFSLGLCVINIHAVELEAKANSLNSPTMVIFSLTYVPRDEPVGGLSFELVIPPGISIGSVGINAPEAGAWSQLKPELIRSGNTISISTLSPAILNSQKSSHDTILHMALGLSGVDSIRSASDIISKFQITTAISPSGAELSDIQAKIAPGVAISSVNQGPSNRLIPRYGYLNRVHKLSFNLAKKLEVRAVVNDISGKAIKLISHGFLEKGFHTISWDGLNNSGIPMSSGVYLIQIEIGTFVYNKKVRHLQ
jgi:hypothetical protein